MFANAESLFYYTAFSRPTKKLLSQEEIKRLLAQATTSSDSPTATSVTVVEGEKESPANVNQGDITIIELGESQLSMDREAMTVTKPHKVSQRSKDRGDMTIRELEDSQLSIDHEATIAIKPKECQSTINHESMAIVGVDDDDGEKDRMHSNTSVRDQQQTFAKSDGVLDDRSNGEIQQEMPPDGQGSSGGAIAYYDAIEDGRIPDMEGTQYEYEIQDVEQNANYSDQIEVQLSNVNFSYCCI